MVKTNHESECTTSKQFKFETYFEDPGVKAAVVQNLLLVAIFQLIVPLVDQTQQS